MFGSKTRQIDIEMFTIYDTKVDAYREPLFAANEHDLYRTLHNTFQKDRDNNKYFLNAEDFQVFKIGDYCFKTGTLNSIEPKHVFNMHDIKGAVLKESPAMEPTPLQGH